jgi:fluoroacetyl-CoA thioesterase
MKITETIPVGASATKTVEVTRDMTVGYNYPGMPEVYATPTMINLLEITAAEAIEKYLPEGWVSVGVSVNIKHLAATPVGLTVTTKAEVISVSENTVTFAVEAHDGIEKIGEGTHARAPVELERFERRVKAKL